MNKQDLLRLYEKESIKTSTVELSCGDEISIRPYLSLADRADFVEMVTASCLATGTNLSAFTHIFNMSLIVYYTDIEIGVIDGSDREIEMLIQSDLIDIIDGYIWDDIESLKNDCRASLSVKFQQIYNPAEEIVDVMRESFEKMNSDISGMDLQKVYSLATDIHSIDTAKLVEVIQQNSKSDESK